jgi:hypothetical protein
MRRFIVLILLIADISHAVAGKSVSRNDQLSFDKLSIEQVISDMYLPSEALVIDPQFDWQYRPKVTMHAPRGDAIPDWWSGNRPLWTKAVVPWFTAFEAQGNRSKNSRVQVRNLRLFLLSVSKREWVEVEQKFRPEVKLWTYPFREVGNACGEQVRLEKDGTVSIVPNYPRFLHGWGRGHEINAGDVGATFTAMEFRLIVNDRNMKDDRDFARYVVDVGADYYPDMALRWSLDYAPGMGNGRMLLARKHWRTATLLIANASYGVTFDDLRRNPPPLAAREIIENDQREFHCPQ